MARLIREGKLSARETMDAHLAQIARVNPKVNAIVTLIADEAQRAASLADEAQAQGQPLGPLHGLPTAHKDLQPTKGIRTTFGSRIFKDFVPSEDSPLVARIKSTGAITLGKTNTPEFGAGSQTFNEVFGATLNPWDLTRTCGGSSGGGAVALACHMLPIADGTDLGASLRNPASFCGVVGFRASAGCVPATVSVPFNEEGPMARTVEDLAFYLAAIAEPEARAHFHCRAFSRGPVASKACAWLGGRTLGAFPSMPQYARSPMRSGACSNPWAALWKKPSPIFPAWMRRSEPSGCTAQVFGSANMQSGIPGSSRIQFFGKSNRARALLSAMWPTATLRHAELQARMRQFMTRYEFFVLPVSQVAPFSVTQPWPVEIDGTRMDTYIDWIKSCYYISVMGTPAISVPCGFTREGLPVGLQIAGRHRDDWGLLQIALAFEQGVSRANSGLKP